MYFRKYLQTSLPTTQKYLTHLGMWVGFIPVSLFNCSFMWIFVIFKPWCFLRDDANALLFVYKQKTKIGLCAFLLTLVADM